MRFLAVGNFDFTYSCGHTGTAYGTCDDYEALQKVPCKACTPPLPGLDFPELVTALKALGFTQVVSFGGPVPLDQWTPYGMTPNGINYRPSQKPYRGEIQERNGETVVVDVPSDGKDPSPFVLGVWKFLKGDPS
jgi:hypothetical protein